jgi:two-component system chemotaxis response regulator CheY
MAFFDHFGIDFKTMRVLLVEDNPFELKVAKSALRELGFDDIVLAADGRKAVKLMEDYPSINLIISDWNMPDMSGIQLLDTARQRWPGVPFVMITGNDTVDHVAEAMRLGVFAYILKPFTLTGLRQKIVAAIRRHLAGGGDQSGEVDAEFQNAIDCIQSITKFSGDDKTQPLSIEISRFEDALESILFSNEDQQRQMDELASAGSAVTKQPGLDGSTVGFLSMLIDQTCSFIENVGKPNAVQLEVIKLHAEIIRSVAAGRMGGKSKSLGPDLFRALNMIVERALAEKGRGQPTILYSERLRYLGIWI